MHLNHDDDHEPYFSLWIFNSSHPERNHHLVIPGANLSCLPANAGSSGWYSGWRVPDDIGTILDLEADEQAVLRAKVKWIDPDNDPLPCESGDPFLFDFDEPPAFDEQYPEVFADSAGVGGETGEPLSFDQFFFQTDGNPPTVTGATGSVNVAFIETHGGSLPATRFLWRWSDGSQYWHNGTWSGTPDFTEIDTNGTDTFSQRWHWDEATGIIAPSGPHGEPFAGFTAAFFGAGTSRTVTIETKMIFDQGGESIEVEGPSLPITFNLNQTDVGIETFTMDGGFGEISHLHTTQGQIPDLSFTIDTDSPDVQDVYLALDREGASLHCGTLTDLENENLFTVTHSTTPSENLRYILTAGNTSELHNLLNGGTGVLQILVATEPCENGTVPQGIEPKTITVNPAESFLVRVHYRDHLGSSVMSKAYSPVFAGSEPGRDPMKLSLGGTTLHLYPRPTEYHHYDPFGAPIPNVANEDGPRYTDHEYDPTSGFNYMKGRFQLAAIAKFNRPDPARDWDWENPHSLNLYQYVRNNPIMSWDPFGLDEFTDDPVARAWLAAMFIAAGSGSQPYERGAWVKGTPKNYHFKLWPFTGQKHKITPPFKNQDGEWNVHTHPTSSEAEPSQSKDGGNDIMMATGIRAPVYTIHIRGIFKYNPATLEITQEADQNWRNQANPETVERVVAFIRSFDKLNKATKKLRDAQKALKKAERRGNKKRKDKKRKKRDSAKAEYNEAWEEHEKNNKELEEHVKNLQFD